MRKLDKGDLSVLKGVPRPAVQRSSWCKPGEHEYGEPGAVNIDGTEYIVKTCKTCGYKNQRYA